jgi:hypothetical protein
VTIDELGLASSIAALDDTLNPIEKRAVEIAIE